MSLLGRRLARLPRLAGGEWINPNLLPVAREEAREEREMKGRPVRQEKTQRKTKLSSKRKQPSTARTPQTEVAAVKSASTAAVEKAEETPPPSLTLPAPVFVRRDITAPDGSVRPGWEMWIGNHCFGRADSKELLLASFQRLQSPPESFHWREVRNRMQMRSRSKIAQPEEERDEPWGWGKKEEPLLEKEEAYGFQELAWEETSA